MATQKPKMTPATKPIQNGGKGNAGTKGGFSQDKLKAVGRGQARAAANGKGY